MATTTSIQHLELLIAIITSFIASSGFWMYMARRGDNKDATRTLLMGLAHDRIMNLCIKYIERGEITHAEYEGLYKYLYEPYKALGGNGPIGKLMEEVNNLKICSTEIYIPPQKTKRKKVENENVE